MPTRLTLLATLVLAALLTLPTAALAAHDGEPRPPRFGRARVACGPWVQRQRIRRVR